MSKPFTTACASVSSIGPSTALGLHQRCAGIFLWKYTSQIAVLPLHADRVGVDVLAVRTKLHFSAWPHRRVSLRDVDGRESVANFLRIGGRRSFECVSEHERLRDEAAGILEDKLSIAFLVFGVNFLRVGVRVMVPVCHALQSFRESADVLVEIGNDEPAGAAVEGDLKAGLLDRFYDQDKVVQVGHREHRIRAGSLTLLISGPASAKPAE